jgi:hypothetical protein
MGQLVFTMGHHANIRMKNMLHLTNQKTKYSGLLIILFNNSQQRNRCAVFSFPD